MTVVRTLILFYYFLSISRWDSRYTCTVVRTSSFVHPLTRTLPNPNTFAEQILTCNLNAASQFKHKRTWRPTLPTRQSASLACTSPLWTPLYIETREGFQVTPAPSCLGYSGPQPWSLPTYHPSQCSLLLWSLANLFTNKDIFNTLKQPVKNELLNIIVICTNYDDRIMCSFVQ